MGKERATQGQEIQRVPKRINTRQNTPKHKLTRLTKTQRANIKSSRERQKITHKGIHIRITSDLSVEISGKKGMAGHI